MGPGEHGRGAAQDRSRAHVALPEADWGIGSTWLEHGTDDYRRALGT